MPETIIYRGPSGTTIDAVAMEAALTEQELCLQMFRETDAGRISIDPWGPPRKLTDPLDDPCTAKLVSTGRISGVVVDEERMLARDRVEGTARLLRRVLPEPSKVIAHMPDEQANA